MGDSVPLLGESKVVAYFLKLMQYARTSTSNIVHVNPLYRVQYTNWTQNNEH